MNSKSMLGPLAWVKHVSVAVYDNTVKENKLCALHADTHSMYDVYGWVQARPPDIEMSRPPYSLQGYMLIRIPHQPQISMGANSSLISLSTENTPNKKMS